MFVLSINYFFSQTIDGYYIIGDYAFDVQKKEVSNYGMFGTVTSDGEGYFPNKNIDYDKAVLLFYGDKIILKEEFENNYPKSIEFNFDYSILKYNYNGFNDDNYIYRRDTKFSTSSYKKIGSYFYDQKKNIYYTVSNEGTNSLEFSPIFGSEVLDYNTLKEIYDETEAFNRRPWIYDKNGLYAITQNDNSFSLVKLADNKKNVSFENYPYYVVFNNKVFSRDWGYKPLNLVANKIKIVKNWNGGFYLTDGNHIYENFGGTPRKMDDSPYAEGYLKSGVNIQILLNERIDLLRSNKDSTVYAIYNEEMDQKAIAKDYIYEPNMLISKINNKIRLLSGNRNIVAKELKIFNADTKSMETVDLFSLHVFNGNLKNTFAYKDKFYIYARRIILPKEIDVPKLRNIYGTNYLTDGKNIVFIDTDIKVSQNVPESYRVVNKNVLIGQDFIISKGQYIKIKDLGIKVYDLSRSY